jgi:hypothetical protein
VSRREEARKTANRKKRVNEMKKQRKLGGHKNRKRKGKIEPKIVPRRRGERKS